MADLFLVVEPLDLDDGDEQDASNCGINDTADYHVSIKKALKQAEELVKNGPFIDAVVYKLVKVAKVELLSTPKIKITLFEDK